MPAHPPRWRAPEPDRLSIVPLDGLTALYDRASGQTHLLADPMPQIPDALAQAPASAAQLADRLAANFDLSADGDVQAVIADRLAELAALGLVERR